MKAKDIKKVIYKKCLVCGKKVRIIHYRDGHCRNAYFYGILEDPIEGTGENVKTGVFEYGELKGDVVKWTGKVKKYEYWECEDCYVEGCFESNLEEKIENLFGKRCKDFEPNCTICNAWLVYDTIIKDNRGKL